MTATSRSSSSSRTPASPPPTCPPSRSRSPRTRSRHRRRQHRRDHLVAWNYYQTTKTPENEKFVAAYKAKYGANRVDDPIEAGYNSVYIWKAAVEKAGTFDVDKVIAAAAGLKLDTPEGALTVDANNHHVYKTARIGIIKTDGLIDEVWNSGSPIKPDPYLKSYTWWKG